MVYKELITLFVDIEVKISMSMYYSNMVGDFSKYKSDLFVTYYDYLGVIQSLRGQEEGGGGQWKVHTWSHDKG